MKLILWPKLEFRVYNFLMNAFQAIILIQYIENAMKIGIFLKKLVSNILDQKCIFHMLNGEFKVIGTQDVYYAT